MVRFRRFCHRAPQREQTADGRTAIRPFIVITPQWPQGTISQERFCVLKIPKKSASKEVYLPKVLCFCASSGLRGFLVGNSGAAPAGSGGQSASSSRPKCFLHMLPVTLKVKNMYIYCFYTICKQMAFMTILRRKMTAAINGMTNLNQTSLVYSSLHSPLFRIAFHQFYVSAKTLLIFDPSLSYLFVSLKKSLTKETFKVLQFSIFSW